MRPFFISAGIKLLLAVILLGGSYYVVNHSQFYYLFIGNLLLLAGLTILVEGVVALLLIIFRRLRDRRKGFISTTRAAFIIIFITDLIIRFTGTVQTYPEQTDGRYFSQAEQEKLDSWYWVHTPNTVIENQKKEFYFRRNVNSLGLSEKELQKNKGSKVRILAIGDSFTEGVGTSYEESWVKQLESRWTTCEVETINAGVGGSDPVYEFALYRDKLTEYRPNLVIVTINSSDIADVISRGGFDRFHADGTAGKDAPSWEWIFAANHLFRLVMTKGFNYNFGLVKNADALESKQKAVKIIQEAIGKFQKLTQEKGAELLIVVQPCIQEFQMGKHVPFFGQTEIINYMKSAGIDYLDASIEFKKYTNNIGDYYYPLDTHFNKRGYALFGETVYNRIDQLGFLK
jgi:lysophospholipase L1-like esterase